MAKGKRYISTPDQGSQYLDLEFRKELIIKFIICLPERTLQACHLISFLHNIWNANDNEINEDDSF
jgi:hypothetical protein